MELINYYNISFTKWILEWVKIIVIYFTMYCLLMNFKDIMFTEINKLVEIYKANTNAKIKNE